MYEFDSSRRTRLRLVVLSPVRVNAEEMLDEADKLDLGLALDEDKKDLVVGHNPAVDSDKH